MAPHPSGLPHPGLALGGGSGLLALSGALGAQLASKDERAHLEAVAAAAAAEHHRGITNKIILTDHLTSLLTPGTELTTLNAFTSAVIMELCWVIDGMSQILNQINLSEQAHNAAANCYPINGCIC